MERRRASLSLGVTSPCRLGSTSSAIRTETLSTPWLNDFEVEGTIGRGKFAVVKKCVEKSTGQPFAAKCIRRRRHNRDCTPDILHEIAVLEMGMKHPHLISLRRVYETNSEFILILEYAAGGEIFDHCVGVKDTFTEGTSRQFMRQILDAVKFLHDNDIVHLDLKPQNILLSKPGAVTGAEIKIVDFGLSKYIANGLEIREILGTPDYVAPEVLNYEPISTATDIWSLGVVAYVMLTGVSPFLGETKQETLMNVTTALLDFPSELFGHLSPASRDFIHNMLQRGPSDRFTAEQSILHPWITGITSPEIPLHFQSQEDGEFEEVFVQVEHSMSSAESVSSDASQSSLFISSCSSAAEQLSSTSPESDGIRPIGEDFNVKTCSQTKGFKQPSNEESDIDYNANLVDDTMEALSPNRIEQCDASGTQESFSQSNASLDLEDIVRTSDVISFPELNNSSHLQFPAADAPSYFSKAAKRLEYNSCVEHSPSASPEIINLRLSNSYSPAQRASSLPDEARFLGTCVDCEGVEPMPLHFYEHVGSSVDPVDDNGAAEVLHAPALIRASDPSCLKHRKLEYCASPERIAKEISVAD